MRICGRHCTSGELLIFAIAYLVGNFCVFKMQQAWSEQQLDEAARNAEIARARAIHKQAMASMNGRASHQDPGSVNIQNREVVQEHGQGEGFHQVGAQHTDGVQQELQPTAERLSPATKAPMLAAGELGRYPSDEDLSEDAELMERQELKRIRLGDPSLAGYKTILFWNKFFNSEDFRFGIGHQPFIDHKCPVHQCITTLDKRKLDHVDMVMFHGPRIEKFPPPRRPHGQIYTYVQQEPHFAMSAEEIPKYNGYMNLTITHRRDGDIWIPYAKVGYDPDKITSKYKKIHPKEKPRSVAWVVSHCSTPGKREWYVQELQKYIDIDIYGDCGDMECSKDDTWYCYEKFAKEYRFYMALENNFCTDYVSEKVFRPLGYDIIPIVFGGGNYSELTPPHSVIDIMDYPNPKDLARHLHYLAENEKAYNRYFHWKYSGYELETSRKTIMGDAFCKVCELLHDPNYKYKEYKNLKSWWTNSMCDPYAIPRMRRKAKW